MTVLFAATLLWSAFLLFLVQPMFAKVVLPLLGGAPAVWNACMFFYQAMLLFGYLYAHLSSRRLSPRGQTILHLILLAASFLLLPVAKPVGVIPPAEGQFAWWLVKLLFVCVGGPFFLVSATAPLLQKWYAGTRAPGAKDPYFLYSASNIGSIGALLAYPVVIEPMLTLRGQTNLWTGGYVALALCIGLCALALWRHAASASASAAAIGGPTRAAASAPASPGALSEDIDWALRLKWLLLSFCPSSLMLGVTNYITTDIASAPLFWVIPLGLYLLTFVIVFARRPVLSRGLMLRVQPYLISMLAIILTLGGAPWLLIPAHLAVFFVVAMVCHGELAVSRPAPAKLTEFYLIMSMGGVLGGLFNALIAPEIFRTILEYPLAIALSCLLRPLLDPAGNPPGKRRNDYLVPAILGLAFGLGIWIFQSFGLGSSAWKLGLLAAAALALFGLADRPVRYGLAVALILALETVFPMKNARVLALDRNFFGVLRVERVDSGGKVYRKLVHGTTVHGVQQEDEKGACAPLAYYHRNGPLGQIFKALREENHRPLNVAAVGLGVGAAADYMRPGDALTFYEINPLVEQIALDERFFRYLSDCFPETRVVLGDARLTLSRIADGSCDLIIMDAFSSDSIPLHLINREALALYMKKLAPDGILAFHVSNRYFDLLPVLGNLAEAAGLEGFSQFYQVSKKEAREMKLATRWAVLFRKDAPWGVLGARGPWRPLPLAPGQAVWTDDYSNILGAMIFGGANVSGVNSSGAASKK